MKRELIIGKYTLESLTNGMYASPLDLYREYIQNSVDSFDEKKEKDNSANNLYIEIIINKVNRQILIKDNGIGIRKEEAVTTLLDIGNSHKKRKQFRGFRGIGRLAGLGYCEKLTFRTSFEGEPVSTIIEFDAALLAQLLLSETNETVSAKDVINQIVSVKNEQEKADRSYFEVSLSGVSENDSLIDEEAVRDYLIQHAPLFFSNEFIWGQSILEKVKVNGYIVPNYKIKLTIDQRRTIERIFDIITQEYDKDLANDLITKISENF